jgi:predicted nucleic acid-binding protein
MAIRSERMDVTRHDERIEADPRSAGSSLPFDLLAARILATYPVPDQAPRDAALIAAIHQSTGMTIATRNPRHFEPLGVSIVNPWSHPE